MPETRRTFIAGLSAASYARVMGANERVRTGFIGMGLIGLRHLADFKGLLDCEVAAVCDVYTPRTEQALAECPGAKGFQDFRKLLEMKDLDAVVISTPDHWHALQTIMACAAGKDVFVEKPMTLFIKEGRWMVDAARRHKRVVLVGTQGRSGTHFKEAIPLIRNGYAGKIHSVRFSSHRNVMPGFGRPVAAGPPAGLDYDLWLGPAPKREYTPHRGLYHFRWFWDYSGGQMTNLGAHDLDLVHWIMQVKGPKSVYSAGGRFALEDDGETPDTQDAIWEYPGFIVEASIREACSGRPPRGTGTAASLAGVQLCGTKGVFAVSRGGYQFVPDMQIAPESAIPPWSKPALHPQPAAIQPAPYAKPVEGRGTDAEPIDLHARHFLDCIKSRQRPNADVEDGHQVAVACHLANLSMKLGRKLNWDVEKEEVIGDKEANQHLERPYRKPWDEVLRSYRR